MYTVYIYSYGSQTGQCKLASMYRYYTALLLLNTVVCVYTIKYDCMTHLTLFHPEALH